MKTNKKHNILVGDIYLDLSEIFLVLNIEKIYNNPDLNWINVYSCTTLKMKRRYPFEFDNYEKL